MKHFRFWAATAATVALVPAAQAHPGHGLGEQGVLHALTSPYHMAVLALIGAACWLAARGERRRLPRQLLQASGIAAILAAAVLLSLRA